MKCPTCGALESGVLETRESTSGLRRRRLCTSGHKFTTYELVLHGENRGSGSGDVVVVSKRRVDQLREAMDAISSPIPA